MAEETKKLKFNGREVDSSLIDLADKYVSLYMDFKNMNQAQQEEFLNEYRNATRHILEGEDWSGNVDNPNILHTGAFTGHKKDDSRSWYGLPRERTNITNSVYEYLTGMAGKVNQIKKLPAVSSANAAASKWVRHSNGSKNSTLLHLIDNLVGNGGAEAWADLQNDRIGDNGERPIIGRQGQLKNTLSNYASDLEGGKYGELDDDRNLELALVRAITEDKGEDPIRTLALYKQLLSDDLYNRLFFTGEKYLNPAQAQLLEQEKKDKAQEATNEAYVRGESPDNPYNPNGTKEERDKYLGLELRKADYNQYMIEEDFKKLPGVYSDYVAPSTTFTTQLYNLHEHPELYQNIDNDELMRYILRAKDLSTDYLGYDIRDAYNGELGHADFSGHGEGDENESLEYLKDYFDAIGETPDDSRNGLGPLFTKAKSNSAILGQYALSMYYNRMASEGKLLDYSIGNGEYVIPETSDWNNGSVYTMKIKNGQAKLMARNIGQLISDLMKLPGSPLLNLMLTTYEKYRRSAQTAADGAKLVSKYAGGGISAAESSYFNTPVTPAGWVSLHNVTPQEGGVVSDDAQIYYNLGIDRGTRELIRFEEGQRSPTSDEFTPTEIARLGAAAADLTGAIAAWLPGYGTATSAVLGVGSTLANLGADFSDESVSAGLMVKNLGLNAVFDVAGLFGPSAAASKSAKVLKNIARYAPKILTIGSTIGLAPEMLSSMQKAFTPGQKLSVEDWKNVAYGLSAIAGTSRIGASAYKTRAYKLKLGVTSELKYTNSKGEPTKKLPTPEQVQKVKNAKTEAEYKKAYKEAFGEEPTGGFNKTSGREGLLGKAKDKIAQYRSNVVPLRSKFVNSADKDALAAVLHNESQLLLNHPLLSKYLNSDFDILIRLNSVLRNPIKQLPAGRDELPSKKELVSPEKKEAVSKVASQLNPIQKVFGALNLKDETTPLHGAMQRALAKNKLDKIKDKKEFVRFLREAFKNKTIAKQKEIIDNMSAKNLLNLRRKWAFKQGGVIPVFKIGNTFKGIIGNSDNALTGLEIGKALYSNYMSDKAARKIKSAPVYLETAGTPISAFVSTNNLQNQFDNIANLTRSTANNLGKLYSTSELQLASRLAGEKQAANYGIEAVKAINDLYNKGMENVLNADNYNIKVRNDVLNRNNKYKISKAESNNSVDAENIRWKGSTFEKLGKVALYGIRAAGQARWNSARTSALNNTARYKELFNAYNLAKANYNLGVTNKLDETLLKPLQEAFTSAERALQSYTNEFNSNYITANPKPLGTPFAVSTPSYVYPGDFFSRIPEYKEGGGIGKMTLAELVKLFRDKERQKYKDKESYRKYLDKYSERVSRANKAIAYQAYIKMLNK